MTSYKEVSVSEVISNNNRVNTKTTTDYSEVLQDLFCSRKKVQSQKDIPDDSDVWNNVVYEIDDATSNLKNEYSYVGLLNEIDSHDVMKIFKKYTNITEINSDNDADDTMSCPEDE